MPNPTPRMAKLQQLLERMPADPFLLYCLAMENKNAGNLPEAIRLFDQTIAADANYAYAYFQRGQAFELFGDVPAAKMSYRDGMAAAKRKNDGHAFGEIEGALMLIE